MSSEEATLNVAVSYGDIKVEFSGAPEAVLVSVMKFLSKHIPTIDLASKIVVNYSVSDLVKMFGEFVKITPEGPRVWPGDRKLSDKAIVALELVATRIGQETGRYSASSLSLAELQTSTGLKSKSISSRLSEMAKLGYVERESTEDGVRYRITTQGIYWLSSFLAKKLSRAR